MCCSRAAEPRSGWGTHCVLVDTPHFHHLSLSQQIRCPSIEDRQASRALSSGVMIYGIMTKEGEHWQKLPMIGLAYTCLSFAVALAQILQVWMNVRWRTCSVPLFLYCT